MVILLKWYHSHNSVARYELVDLLFLVVSGITTYHSLTTGFKKLKIGPIKSSAYVRACVRACTYNPYIQ